MRNMILTIYCLGYIAYAANGATNCCETSNLLENKSDKNFIGLRVPNSHNFSGLYKISTLKSYYDHELNLTSGIEDEWSLGFDLFSALSPWKSYFLFNGEFRLRKNIGLDLAIGIPNPSWKFLDFRSDKVSNYYLFVLAGRKFIKLKKRNKNYFFVGVSLLIAPSSITRTNNYLISKDGVEVFYARANVSKNNFSLLFNSGWRWRIAGRFRLELFGSIGPDYQSIRHKNLYNPSLMSDILVPPPMPDKFNVLNLIFPPRKLERNEGASIGFQFRANLRMVYVIQESYYLN